METNLPLPIHEFLIKNGFIAANQKPITIGLCRDLDVKVFQDKQSGVIYIDPEISDHNENYYFEKFVPSQAYPRNDMDWADTARRSKYLAPLISGKRWLDFGCGPGYQLRNDFSLSSAHVGVELNEGKRQSLQNEGFVVAKNLSEILNFQPQIISMFHVLEHLSDPVKILSDLYTMTDINGHLLIEVPHAKDLLLSSKTESFMKFTLWSEHLVLHTRNSLKSVVEAAGWIIDEIISVQRYPVWNHMAWLSDGIPTGLSASLNDSAAEQLSSAYQHFLAARDRTDTLILTASKKGAGL
ncbi:MAG: hypothetical protein RL416_144 [Pseudomonadota bacterium]